jgi:YfiH family protein
VIPDHAEVVQDFADFGIHAFTTTRQFGSVGTQSTEPVRDVMQRWDAVRAELASLGVRRLATSAQVHGARVQSHGGEWQGWLRGPAADGQAAIERGTGLAVTIADCVPIFIAHQSGSVALLHSGWRGTAARIIDEGIAVLTRAGHRTADLRVHLGPAICGKCYEVSPDVYQQVTGRATSTPTTVDLRAVIAQRARELGVGQVSVSKSCTRCDNDRFFSHRAGDAGRQLAVIAAA